PDAPINGLAVALAAGGTFLARGFSAHPKQLVELLKTAIMHRGFSIVEVMSPCLTFNKINTYAWFKENVAYVNEIPDYDATDRTRAFDTLLRDDKIPLGVIYQQNRPTLEELSHLPELPIAQVPFEATGELRPRYAKILDAYR
ncbi:MAG: 2-oxoacid:ferredoxin oxidoreductase subunit beta, partial [Vulcanimicrobiaceae bacterium]